MEFMLLKTHTTYTVSYTILLEWDKLILQIYFKIISKEYFKAFINRYTPTVRVDLMKILLLVDI